MATTGGTEEKGEVGEEMGLSRRQSWPTRDFTPQAAPSGLGLAWVRRRYLAPKRRYLGRWGADWKKNGGF